MMHAPVRIPTCEILDTGHIKCEGGKYHLIGDGGYTLSPWIRTRYRRMAYLTEQQSDYNRLYTCTHYYSCGNGF